jgi:glycosyltransferase involved in cell wall biosynthesis
MKLLHVICTTDSESGGPVEALQRIAAVLTRDGHTIHVVSLEDPAEVEKRSFNFPLQGTGPGIGKYRFTRSLTPLLRRKAAEYDAVVVHGLWNYSSAGVWRALRNHRTPYFVFVHGMMDPWFRKEYPFKHVAKQIYWTLIEGRVLGKAKRVLFTCGEEMVRARNVFRGPAYRERVVLYGTADPSGDPVQETAEFAAAFRALEGRKFLLFLSRIHPKKGCDLLIHAFADCIADVPSDLDLVMAGPDQVGWVHKLKQIAGERGIAHRVHWTGMLKGNLRWGAFRSAEAMILPSHQENFGFVVAESMACSTPVLISDKVNIWREVENARGGFVEPDTEEGARNLIRRFLALSAEEHAEMRRSARQGFVKNFDIEVSARDFATMIATCKDPVDK